MNTKIIKILPEWQRIKLMHEQKVGDIQFIVDGLTEYGLRATSEDVADLVNGGHSLYDKAANHVKSNIGVFKLPMQRKRIFDENLKEYTGVIEGVKSDLKRVLQMETKNPLMPEAYTIDGGKVSISGDWVERLVEMHTIRETEKRVEAVRLCKEVETAIANINDFVKDNELFYKGFSYDQFGDRALCYIDNESEFYVEEDNLQYI